MNGMNMMGMGGMSPAETQGFEAAIAAAICAKIPPSRFAQVWTDKQQVVGYVGELLTYMLTEEAKRLGIKLNDKRSSKKVTKRK